MEQQQEMTHTISMFEREKVALEQQLQTQKQKSQKIEGEKDTLVQWKETATSHIAALKRTIEALYDKVGGLEAALTLADTKAEMLESKNKKLSKTIFELQQSHVKDRLEKKQLTTENDKQRRNSKMLGEKVRKLGNVEIELKSELDEAKERIADAEQRILDAQQEIEFKNAELEQMDDDAKFEREKFRA